MSQRKGSAESGQEFICSLSVVVKLSDYFIFFSCFIFLQSPLEFLAKNKYASQTTNIAGRANKSKSGILKHSHSFGFC